MGNNFEKLLPVVQTVIPEINRDGQGRKEEAQAGGGGAEAGGGGAWALYPCCLRHGPQFHLISG